MNIEKAVITAAGPGQRALPLQSIVDRDGQEKPAIAIILAEAQSAGVEAVTIVVHPNDQDAFAAATDGAGMQITFTTQAEPRGYGHALFCARDFVGDAPFLHLVSDHLHVSHGAGTCAREVVEVARAENAAVSAVQSTREHMLPYYGVVGGTREQGYKNVYAVQQVREKPTPTQAEQDLMVPGLRAGHYLCFYGIHVLTPTVMQLLAEDVAAAADDAGARVQLSPALDRLAGKERYLACEVAGQRFNIGVKYGILNAQLALALSGVDREEVLTQLVELLASRERHGAPRSH